jgi:hypothetical protein
MAYTFIQFDNGQELVDYLNGVVVGIALPSAQRVTGLHGLTLIINDGTADRTVTFSDPSGVGLLPKQISDQIHAAHVNLANGVTLRNYGHAAPPRVKVAVTTATYIVKNTGTANAILGFSTTAPGSTVGANAVAKADIITVFTKDEGNRFGVVHE